MPSVIRMLNKQFRTSSWRVLATLCGMPSLLIACASSLLPLSPRHLLYRRRPIQALGVLRQMYAINNSKHADTYPVRRSNATPSRKCCSFLARSNLRLLPMLFWKSLDKDIRFESMFEKNICFASREKKRNLKNAWIANMR